MPDRDYTIVAVRHGAANVPDESSVLCEGCGYTLDGLPGGSRCPECGLEIAASRQNDGRNLPEWEDPARKRATGFLATSYHVLFHPARFYRTLLTRADNTAASRFAMAHWLISAMLLGAALSIHLQWEAIVMQRRPVRLELWMFCVSVPGIWLVIWLTTRAAAWLSAWEATYRGIRLPLPVVLRGLYYHSVHYLPVGLAALATTAGFAMLVRRGVLSANAVPNYLLVLSVQVVISAGYLFKTYWTAMRGMMYANR